MKKAKILVVEDESIVAWHVKEALHRLGHEVIAIARSAQEAIQVAAAERPDLVLMDICLQGQSDGVSAAEHLYLNLDLPVVYLTAYTDEATLQRATQTTPFGFLLKPFQELELRSTIQVALRRHQLEQAIKAAQQWYATTLVSIGEATIATDVDGFIAFMNPAAEYLTGWTQEEALGEFASRVLILIHQDSRAPIENPIVAALCQGETVCLPAHTLLQARDGTEHWIGNSASPIRNRAGAIVGSVMVFQDLGDGKPLESPRSESIVLSKTASLHPEPTPGLPLTTQLQERTSQFQQTIFYTQLLRRLLHSLQDPIGGDCIPASLLERVFAPTMDPLSCGELHHRLQQTLQELGQTVNVQYGWAALHDHTSTTSTIVCDHRAQYLSTAASLPASQSFLPSPIQIEQFPWFYLRLFQRGYWVNPVFDLLPPTYQTLLAASSATPDLLQVLICPIQWEQRVIGELGIVAPTQADALALQASLISQMINQTTRSLQHTQRYQVIQTCVQELHRLNQLKDEFIQTLAHELQTPLTSQRQAIKQLRQITQTLQNTSLTFPLGSASQPAEVANFCLEGLLQQVEQYLQISQQGYQEELDLVSRLLSVELPLQRPD